MEKVCLGLLIFCPTLLIRNIFLKYLFIFIFWFLLINFKKKRIDLLLFALSWNLSSNILAIFSNRMDSKKRKIKENLSVFSSISFAMESKNFSKLIWKSLFHVFSNKIHFETEFLSLIYCSIQTCKKSIDFEFIK